MPKYLLHLEMWKSLWPLFVLALFITFFFFLFFRSAKDRFVLFFILFSFSILGCTTGFITGLSRSSAVNSVLPAILSLIGGLGIFLIREDKNRVIISFAVSSFALTLLISMSWGAVLRDISDEYRKSTSYLKKQALTEIEVREFRKLLGLPEENITLKTNTLKK